MPTDDKRKMQAAFGVGAVCLLLVVFITYGLATSPPPGSGATPQPTMNPYAYPTPTPTYYPYYSPYPTWTYPPEPTYSPDSLSAFSITQRVTEEYLPSYVNPASYQPVITNPWGQYTHAISIWGSYQGWSFDVYVQIGSSGAFWVKATSGITDGSGNGAAYIPIFAENAGQEHNVCAVINPNGGVPVDYGGFTAGEMTSLVSAGVLRQSNILSFEVVTGGVL